MTTPASPAPAQVDDLSAADLLVAARQRRVEADRAEADLLIIATQWADLHPAESTEQAAGFTSAGSEHVEPIAGPGCPEVAEFCLAELGAVLGMSTLAATRLVGQALELRHRLPRLWRRVQAGEVPAWRARRVAETTIHASPELSEAATDWVDAQVAWTAERIGVAALDRVVAEAITRHSPPRLAEDPQDPDPPRPDTRTVRIGVEEVSWHGTVTVLGELDLADALDLDRAVATGAAEAPTASRGGADLPAARQLVLHLHLSAAALTGSTTAGAGSPAAPLDPVGRMEEGQRLVLTEQIRSWCADSHTQVVVRPVIDLNTGLGRNGYQPSGSQRDHVVLRDRTCLFPWCDRPARGCDVDHVRPYDHDAESEGRPQPGPTHTDNLAALCRRHHRIKTHGRWQVRANGPGILIWTSPHGHRYRTDATGTSRLTESCHRRPRRRP